MKNIPAYLISASIALTLLCACQPAPAADPTQPAALTPSATLAQPTSPVETPLMNEVPIPTPFDAYVAKLADQARADLAQRLALDPATIELVDASSVTWPDSSLGCPQPGMLYTQALVEGVRLRLRAKGMVYTYHSGGSRAPFLCEK